MPSAPSRFEPSNAIATSSSATFGPFLRQLRRRVGLTQGELAARVGFSIAQISRLEKNERLPDLTFVAQKFLPALALDDEPRLGQHLLALAAQARGERLPAHIQVERRIMAVVQEEIIESDSQLPSLPMPLVGREHDLDVLTKRIMDAPGRLLTLTGPPGVGKTQLALAAADRLHRLFSHGACFIALAAITDPENVAAAIATGLGLAEADGKAPQVRLVEHLRRKMLLLILDNFEQVTPAAMLVAQLLAECAQLRILVTSQEPLRLRSEQRQRVEPLGVAAAVELFFQRAQAIEPAFETSNEQAALAAEICLQLDCLPLAIELLAAQTEIFSLPQLLTRLANHRLDLLEDGPRDLSAHHRTLRNAIHRSYALLSAQEQQLFRALSVFVGGCSIEALSALMCADATEQVGDLQTHHSHAAWSAENVGIYLRKLVRKSLVQVERTPESTRYNLLTMLYEYAAEQLAQQPEQTRLRQAHAHYFAALAQQLSQQPTRKGHRRWPDSFDLDHDNLRAALHWSLQADITLGLKLTVVLADFWATRGHDFEARQWLRQVLSAYTEQTTDRAAALLAASSFARRQADYGEAEACLAESLCIYTAQKKRAGLAETLRQDGWLQYDLHRKEPTLERFRQSLALHRELGDREGIANLLLCLVHVMLQQPAYAEQVNAYLAESLSLFQELKHRDGMIKVLQYQGEKRVMSGEYAAAQEDFRAALALWRESDARLNVAWALAQVGEAAWLQNDLGTASQSYGEAYEIFHKLGNKDGIAILLHHRAQVARRQGDLVQAHRLYTESLQMSLDLQNQYMAARCQAGLGAVALAKQDRAGALTHLTEAQQIFSGLPPFLAPADEAEFQQIMMELG